MATTVEIAPARVAALKVLSAVRRGAFADQAFDRVAGSLGDADRRLAQEMAYGALRLRGRLDHLLERLVDGGVDALHPVTLDVLRLGAYQLLQLDRVPAYAAVSEAVEAARRSGQRPATGLVNAVLRRLAREERPERLFPGRAEDAAGHLATWGSHPRWLIKRWLARWSEEDVARLVEYDNRPPPVCLSVAGDPGAALRALSERGIAAEPVGRVPGSIRIDAARLSDALASVRAIVQDPAAATVVAFTAPGPGDPVVDLCAAPGGKAASLALRGHPVLAFDASRRRLARLAETRDRLGLEELWPGVADATAVPLRGAAAVLLDVPCTGTGTLARHADARWRITPDGLSDLVALQRRMLEAAAEIVTVGGVLVYATCSLEPEENEGQVEWFLRRHPRFEREAPPRGVVAAEMLSEAGELRTLPQRDDMDGAYAARLRRTA